MAPSISAMDHYSFGPEPVLNRREQRKERAKVTANKIIPDHLRSCPRSRHGIHKAGVIVDPPPAFSSEGLDRHPASLPRIRVQCCDTLTAAGQYSERPYTSKRSVPTLKATKKAKPNVAVLNMASLTRPGGGFLDGANSQEEFLCARTTLFPSMWDSFYPLPDLGGVWTPDVMVFRDTTPEANDLEKRDRFFIDVLSAGMLRFPDARARLLEEELVNRSCTCGISYCDRDRDLVTRKMRAVLRIAQSKGTERLILGAWGCGAYGNPVKEIAKLWRKVVAGGPRQRKPNAELWQGIKEIVFAVPDQTMAREFNLAFGDVLATSLPTLRLDADCGASLLEKDAESADLTARIAEIEVQIELWHSHRGKSVLDVQLAGYRKDVAQGMMAKAIKDEDQSGQEGEEEKDEDEDDYVTSGYSPSEADDNDEGNSIYNFDENDVASDSSDYLTPDALELRPTSQADESEVVDDVDVVVEHHLSVLASERYDKESGWFTGSVDELHDLLKARGVLEGASAPSPASPVAQEAFLDFEHLHRAAYVVRLEQAGNE